jgi:K(+)-stimulated pyrophosphate-energized sodium pump
VENLLERQPGSAIGLLFGLLKYQKLRNLPAHKAMIEISELIYATCKTYLKTQAKFIAYLWVLIAAVILVYFAVLEKVPFPKVMAIAAFSVIGILGSTLVAFFGIRVNNFANSRAAFWFASSSSATCVSSIFSCSFLDEYWYIQ